MTRRRMPEGMSGDARKPIPRRTMRAAAVAAGVLTAVIALGLLAGWLERGGDSRVSLSGAVLLCLACFAALYVLILFALLRMGARADGNRRGGRPDPF